LQNEYRIKKSEGNIVALHNAYEGRRCFIIGNGPSLTIDDLEKLNGEICFGTHGIYKLFDKTSWRPKFYCAQDFKLICEKADEINNFNVDKKFIAVNSAWKYPKLIDTTYVRYKYVPFYPELPEFSSNVADEIFEGFTVTYMCLQLAAYMGFKEIYLVGVDHNYSIDMNPDGTIKYNNSGKDHFYNDNTLSNIPQTYKSTLAYKAARKYMDEHGIKIYNASRGGKLETFERVNLDCILK
jgi:hypothetical protein